MDALNFTVEGKPEPQGSATRNRYGAIYDSNKGLKPWRATVTSAAAEALLKRGNFRAGNSDAALFLGPVEVNLTFVFKRPKGHYGSGRNAALLKGNAPGYKDGKPDLDKLSRAVIDALDDAGVVLDDGQVARLNAVKHWGAQAGVSVSVHPLETTR